MICPYCVEDVSSDSKQHSDCKVAKDKFPALYIDFHGKAGTRDPVIVSVVGFTGHGKTVFLCALFDFLDNVLTRKWPGFYTRVLDQDSLNRVEENRRRLRNGDLPPKTGPNFHRPGIFRLTNMPYSDHSSKIPPLQDTTVLIYDPPGEAFVSQEKIEELASFVKRSSCVLFLVDITAFGEAVADEMAKLLGIYNLGIRKMEITEKFQHLVVVYTKSDKMKSEIPEFRSFLAKESSLNEYLSDPEPKTLVQPSEHINNMEHISDLLEVFTRDELKAERFISEAKDRFKSVSYTCVSSLGSPPEEQRLTVRMAPRCVADPLLYVLAKSKGPERQSPHWLQWLKAGCFIVIALLMLVVCFSRRSNSRSEVSPVSKDVTADVPVKPFRALVGLPPRVRLERTTSGSSGPKLNSFT